jgi:hypothetical protein
VSSSSCSILNIPTNALSDHCSAYSFCDTHSLYTPTSAFLIKSRLSPLNAPNEQLRTQSLLDTFSLSLVHLLFINIHPLYLLSPFPFSTRRIHIHKHTYNTCMTTVLYSCLVGLFSMYFSCINDAMNITNTKCLHPIPQWL